MKWRGPWLPAASNGETGDAILWNPGNRLASAGMSLDAVRRAVLDVPGVLGVHHLHLWEVSERDVHFEAHVVLADQPVSEAAGVREAIQQAMAGQFGLTHCTLQFEDAGSVCPSVDLP